MKYAALIFLIVCLGCAQQNKPKIIFDTDFGGDADDLGALAMLHHMVDRDECELLAVMCWNVEPYAVSGISAVNDYYQHPEIPIATRKDEGEPIQWQHSKVLTESFSYTLDRNAAPETTTLYRKILSESKGQEITIVTVGPMSNIKRLLESGPDDISPLSGKDLISQKVKEFVVMGGQYPSGKDEWNFNGNMPGVTQFVIDQLKTPVTFLGYEVGVDIKSGEVFNDIDKNSPLYVGFSHFSKFCPWLNEAYEGKIYDNSTYDQTAVLYAIRGGIGNYWERVKGQCLPDSVGGNQWKDAPNGPHSYLKLLKDQEEMATLIEALMLGE